MGRDKALLRYQGKTFLNHLVYLSLPRVDSVVVVVGHHAEQITPTLPTSPRVEAVVNHSYDLGMLSSLQRGLHLVANADWVLWMLVDHPAVRGRTLDQLLGAAKGSRAPVVIPTYSGDRGHPVLLSRMVAAELLRLSPDRSPQDVVRNHYGKALFVETDDDGVLADIDRRSDYDRLVSPAGAT